MVKHRTRRVKKGGLFGSKETVAPRPGYATNSSSTLRAVGQKNFNIPIAPAPTTSEKDQDDYDYDETIGELKAVQRLTPQKKGESLEKLNDVSGTNPMFNKKKAGRKSRRKTKKITRKRK